MTSRFSQSCRLLGALALAAWLAVPVTQWASRHLVPRKSVVLGTPGETALCLSRAEGLVSVEDTVRVRETFVDFATGRKRCEIPFEIAEYSSSAAVVHTPEDRILVAKAVGGNIRIWDLEAARECASISTRFTNSLVEVRFSPDGSRLLAACDSCVQFWDTSTGRLAGELSIPNYGGSGEISPDGHWLASYVAVETSECFGNHRVQIRDIATGRVQAAIYSPFAFSTDGGLVAGLDEHLVLHVWDIADWRLLATYRSSRWPLALSSGGGLLAMLPADSPNLPAWLPGSIAHWITSWSDRGNYIGLLDKSDACIARLPSGTDVRFVNEKTLASIDANRCTLTLWDVPPKTLVPRPTPWLALGVAILLSAATWRFWRLASRGSPVQWRITPVWRSLCKASSS